MRRLLDGVGVLASVLHSSAELQLELARPRGIGQHFLSKERRSQTKLSIELLLHARYLTPRRWSTREPASGAVSQCCPAAMDSIRLLITVSAAVALRPLIIFGRPGAGKSTIAERLVAHPDADGAYNADLDVCVPQWMRDNFAQGIYPTLAERQAFASDAADYVSTESDGKDAAAKWRESASPS